MKITNSKAIGKTGAILLLFFVACSSPGNKNEKKMKQKEKEFEQGTYGYDVAFLKENNVETIELKDAQSKACLVLAPGYQGRVMTSTSGGSKGQSFGWINYGLIQSGKVSNQFNPVGGEERFWLGPEGGPFSIYFDEGKEQVSGNWRVPPVIDTERYDVKEQNAASATFTKSTILKNASGTEFHVGIERTVRLVPADSLSDFLNVSLPGDVFNVVAFRSDNSVKNNGGEAWRKEDGLLSIWLLCMFSPSPTTTVFIPFNQDGEGTIVNDDYFGKVPSDRLVVEDGVVYFKIDGAYRSKIGIPPGRAKELCGSYDSASKTLTLVWGSLPQEPKSYVNSKWGEQDDPYDGDVINAYNDGPTEDGSIFGPFYEIETSSPAAELKPQESLTHSQVTVHVQGNEPDLANLVRELFDLDLDAIATKFK